MLRLVLGQSPDEKLDMYADEISRLLSGGKDVVAIVPDQFSFEFDKTLYLKLGAKDFNKVRVLSFKKLANELIDRFGAKKGALLRQEERIAVIYLALKRVKKEKNLRILARSLDKPAFIGETSGLMDSLIRSGISPDMLDEAAGKLQGSVCDKLCDVADIYRQYLLELDEGGYFDESSVISLGAKLAAVSGYFKGKYVYVDRFDSYSNDELTVLEEAIKTASEVSVSLTLPESFKPSIISPYKITADTQRKLIDLAAKNNRHISYVSYNPKIVKAEGITRVESCLLGLRQKDKSHTDGVTLISASTLYEEADFVAAQIRRLVSGGDYGYNDITVLTRDIASYQAALESSFERYDVPYFIDSKSAASDSSVMLFCFAVINAASARKPSTEKIMQMVCSPFSGFNETEISAIDDYCVRWNIDGELWLDDFKASDGDVPLEEINRIREKIISPLRELHDSCKNTDAASVSVAFNRYLDGCGLARQARGIIDDFTADDEKLTAARLFKQLWNALMNAVATIYNTIGQRKLTLKEFGELLRLMLSEQGIATPPQKLSCVKVCDVSRSVIFSTMAAFVVGVNDGAFPPDAKKTGIFSGRDVVQLEEQGIKFEAGESDRLAQENLNSFMALSCAVEKLYISYSESKLGGTLLRPSFIVTKLVRALGLKCIKASSLTESFYSSTPKAAYYRLGTVMNISSERALSIRSALERLPEYKKKLAAAAANSCGAPRRLSAPVARKLFAPRDINITASRIDVYNRCSFQYFMRYGLEIKRVEPMAVDPANRGSVMHYVFQRMLEHYGADYQSASDEEIASLVAQFLEEYKAEQLGSDFGKTAKFESDYARLNRACVDVLLNIRDEYRVSKFKPVRFEYDLTKEDGTSMLSIPVSTGGRSLKINIRGIVDRVDAYRVEDGCTYIRITDYKTGSKELRLEDIYNGLNLQMLLYMLALTDGEGDFGGCRPAGVMYMKAGFLKCEDDFTPSEDAPEQRSRRSASQLRRSGLIVKDDELIQAMDSDVSGLYLPVSRLKSGGYKKSSSLISPESFKLLEDFSKGKVKEFGSGLLLGKIDPVPCGSDKNHLVCAYCDYSSVCDRRKYMYKLIQKEDSEKLMKIIGCEDLDDGEGDK